MVDLVERSVTYVPLHSSTKLPLLSMLSSKPLWIDDNVSGRQPSLQRTDYRPHYQSQDNRIKANSCRPQVWALRSTLPIKHNDYLSELSQKPVVHDTAANHRYWRRRDQIPLNKEPFDVYSVYRKEFIPRIGERCKIEKVIPAALRSEEPFTSKSSYTTDFTRKSAGTTFDPFAFDMNRSKSVHDCMTWRIKPGNRDNKTPHQMDTFAPADEKRTPLETDTMYRVQFQGYSPSQVDKGRAMMHKPQEKMVQSSSPFNSVSEHQDNYQRKEIPVQEDSILQNVRSMGYFGVGVPETSTQAELRERGQPFLEHKRNAYYHANNPQYEICGGQEIKQMH